MASLQRKLCYSAYTYYFTIPKNTRSNWLGRSFKLTVLQNPLTFTFEEREFDVIQYREDITCFQIAQYEALRVPKKVVESLREELELDSPKNNALFNLEYTIGQYNRAVFTKIEVEEVEITNLEHLVSTLKPRGPRKKFVISKENYLIVHQLGFEENLHIANCVIINDSKAPLKRSLCRTVLNLDTLHFEIETWGTLKHFHYC